MYSDTTIELYKYEKLSIKTSIATRFYFQVMTENAMVTEKMKRAVPQAHQHQCRLPEAQTQTWMSMEEENQIRRGLQLSLLIAQEDSRTVYHQQITSISLYLLAFLMSHLVAQ